MKKLFYEPTQEPAQFAPAPAPIPRNEYQVFNRKPDQDGKAKPISKQDLAYAKVRTTHPRFFIPNVGLNRKARRKQAKKITHKSLVADVVVEK